MKRLAALALLPVMFAVVGYHLFGTWRDWVMPLHIVVSAVCLAALIATIGATCAGARRIHVGLAVGLLSVELVLLALKLAGIEVLPASVVPDSRVETAMLIAVTLAVYGLVRGRMWGRWLGIALGAIGALSGLLNQWGYWSVTREPLAQYLDWSRDVYRAEWAMCAQLLGGVLIVTNLAMPVVRDAYVAHGTVWASRDRLMTLLRATVIASFGAVPMLLVYAWVQPVAPATQGSALVLAAALAVAGGLAVRGRVIGALLLVGTGLGLIAQTAVTYAETAQPAVAAYYAAFWLPAGLLAAACGVRMVGPTIRLLRK